MYLFSTLIFLFFKKSFTFHFWVFAFAFIFLSINNCSCFFLAWNVDYMLKSMKQHLQWSFDFSRLTRDEPIQLLLKWDEEKICFFCLLSHQPRLFISEDCSAQRWHTINKWECKEQKRLNRIKLHFIVFSPFECSNDFYREQFAQHHLLNKNKGAVVLLVEEMGEEIHHLIETLSLLFQTEQTIITNGLFWRQLTFNNK